MKKIILILFLIILLFLIGFAKVLDEKPELDELQITACEEADKSGTCQSRLIEVGIVMPDKCCEILGRCCENE